MPKKEKELKYEKVDRVSRWNYCQQIASLLYQSELSNEDLEKAAITFKFNNKQVY